MIPRISCCVYFIWRFFFYYKSNGFERARKKQFDQKLSAQKREVCRKCLHVKLLLQKHYEEFRGIMDFTTSHQNKKKFKYPRQHIDKKIDFPCQVQQYYGFVICDESWSKYIICLY